jgi:type IV pilus assembly protein PilA
MQKQQSGFTLIELMIVVAIIGILASVSIPMYRDYIVRTKIATVLATVGNLKTALTITNNEGTAIPALVAGTTDGWSTIGMRTLKTTEIDVIDDAGVTVTAVTGVITIAVSEDIAGSGVTVPKIIMTPTFGGSVTTWQTSYTATAADTDDEDTVALIQAYLAANAGGS